MPLQVPSSLGFGSGPGLVRGALAAAFLLLISLLCIVAEAKHTEHWVGIWTSMPQLVEPANLPNAPYNGSAAVFENTTLRQTVFVTQDASVIRLSFSNAFGGTDLAITAVTVALPAAAAKNESGAGASGVRPETAQTVTFSGGRPGVTVSNGALAVSDPLKFTVRAQSVLSVTLYLAGGQPGHALTGHPGSRTSSWAAPGNLVAAPDLANVTSTTAVAARIYHWYFLSAIDGWLPASRTALAIVGDSISDGRGSTTNANNRWPDQLLARLQQRKDTAKISVLNQAAGGNRVLADGLGPNAVGRIGRDVIAQAGVRYALVLEGVNDLGTAAADAAAQGRTGDVLVAAYAQITAQLHGHGIAVFGATITPFTGPGQAYGDDGGSGAREAQRQRVNAWIRTSGRFDYVVDFDAAVRDPANATQLSPLYNSGDYLHLNPDGYRAMAAAVDLAVFAKFAGGVRSMV
ncbi:SGNH hydrolase-type esterase domain-containing protein [Lasiosphaeria miniovina]|uniref:SGNH hydrolase-type esterase domain-containing protein n=1 Tax=Lasiosphaeria miniovina TaxID=1954250 RepID=A0AA40EBP5_9PEZI|nr:SGNH hydrolase-type esterase domain-containing protein [Lasiosphaeria miniovina]KAK0734090.1 SGNH hydrolase-type esterase domain-containing protein [Lasiosphaeria miniovina]